MANRLVKSLKQHQPVSDTFQLQNYIYKLLLHTTDYRILILNVHAVCLMRKMCTQYALCAKCACICTSNMPVLHRSRFHGYWLFSAAWDKKNRDRQTLLRVMWIMATLIQRSTFLLALAPRVCKSGSHAGRDRTLARRCGPPILHACIMVKEHNSISTILKLFLAISPSY